MAQIDAVTAAAESREIPIALRPLLWLAGPVVAQRLGIMAMGLTDTIVVGRYSATELGYNALGWAPTAVVLTTAIGLLSGIQVMTSQAIGEGRARDTGAILRRGLLYSLWIGLAAFVILAGLGGPLMHNIGLTASLADGATPVLQLFALSLPLILIADAGIFWLEAHGRPVPGMVAIWAANAVNLALNLWLVPGAFGLCRCRRGGERLGDSGRAANAGRDGGGADRQLAAVARTRRVRARAA